MSQPLAIDTPGPIQTAIDDLEGEINLDDFVPVNFKNPAPGLQAYRLRPTASYQKKINRIGSLLVDEFVCLLTFLYRQTLIFAEAADTTALSAATSNFMVFQSHLFEAGQDGAQDGRGWLHSK